MTAIQVFTFPVSSQVVRVKGDIEFPWFCLTDICSILGLSNPSDLAKKQLKQDGIDKIEVIDSLGRPQYVLFINEPNLYRCVLRSSKPEAEAFQDWIVEKVVPTIRKTGSFGNVPNSESGGSELWALIDGAIARNMEPERVIDLHLRFTGKQSASAQACGVSKQPTVKPEFKPDWIVSAIKIAATQDYCTVPGLLDSVGKKSKSKADQMHLAAALKAQGFHCIRKRINGSLLRCWVPTSALVPTA